MTFSTLASPGVSLQGGGGSGGGGGGTPGGSNTQIQYNSSGTFAGASGLTTNGTELTIASGAKTADAPVLNMSQTWNNGAVTFTGLKFNAATGSSAGSAAASLLMDLQLEGTSKVSVRKTGAIAVTPTNTTGPAGSTEWLIFRSDVTATGIATASGGLGSASLGFFAGSTSAVQAVWSSGTILNNSSAFGWTALGSATAGGFDTLLTRRAAANLRLGAADAAAPVAQTLSVQSGTAGASATTVSISGTALTIAGTVTGTIAIGHAVTGTGVSAGTLITAGSGTSWTVNNSQTVGPITAYFNSVGQNLTLTGSQGSGPSAGGSIIFQVAPAGAAATTAQNALATALTIDSTKLATFAASTVSISGATISNSSGNMYVGGSVTNIGDANTQIGSSNNGLSGQTAGVAMMNTRVIAWSSDGNWYGTKDLILARDDANKLALRNGTNAQTFNVYGTYTDGSNYERLAISASTTAIRFASERAGTGSNRYMQFTTSGGAYFDVVEGVGLNFRSSAGTNYWQINSSGHFLAGTDNLYDIGASGATRPRNVYAGTNFIVPATGNLFIQSRGYYSSSGDGVFTLYNAAATGFDRLQFGGTTSSFPALKRSSTTLQARLADDSAFASVQGKLTTDTAYQAGDPATTGYLVVYDSTGTAYKIPALAVA